MAAENNRLEDIKRATTLKKPSPADFKLILRHGYQVAECTAVCYKAKKEGM